MIRLAMILPALLMFAPAESRAQGADIIVTPYQLRTMAPAKLGELLFGPATPAFDYAWVEGPTRQSDSISVALATTPAETRYAGLCRVKIGLGWFDWHRQAGGEDIPVALGGTPWVSEQFVLSSDVPALTRAANDPACARVFSQRGIPREPIHLSFSPGILGDEEDADAVARFGLMAVAAAAAVPEATPVRTERCVGGATAIPLACNAPRDFAYARKLRDVRMLNVSRCGGGFLCVDAAIARHNSECGMVWWAGVCGEDHLVIETDIATLSDGEKLDARRITAITVRAGSDPIHD